MANQIENQELAIKLTDVKKMYKIGQIGGGTLQADIQSWWAKKRGMEDPNTKIGEQRLIGQTFMALNGIDLEIYKGEAIGIIGGNGAGKSTMLKLLSRVTAPTSGKIQIWGRVASMLEVGTGFNGEMTGRENVYMNGTILGMTKAEIDAKMEDIIEFSEVRDFIDTPVKRYSSGMYVKLAFSVAAHLDSEIMIMDEVLAVGDMAFQKKCLDKMRDAAQKEGRTVLYVSHNMNTIRQLCDRCIVLDKGKIVYNGDVEHAIALYLGTEKNLESHYVYTDTHRKRQVPPQNRIFQELRILNKENLICDTGELLEMELLCKTESYKEDIAFRFEVKSQDGSIVGTMMTDNTICIPEGVSTIRMSLDTMHLMEGRYRIELVAFQFDTFGNELLIDAVYPGFFLEISGTQNFYNNIQWISKWWGHVRLHNVCIQ